MGERMPHVRSALVQPAHFMLRFWGRLQAVSMAFQLGSGEIASIVAGASAVAFELVSAVGETGNEEAGFSPLLVLGILAIIVPAIRELVTLFSSAASYKVQGGSLYRRDVLERLALSSGYRQSGYEIRQYEDGSSKEWYVSSDSVDRVLFDINDGRGRALDVDLSRGWFKVPEEVRPVVLAVLSGMFSKNKGKRLVNGKLVKMCGDLLFIDEEGGRLAEKLSVQGCRYFDGQCTHEIVFKRAPNVSSLTECFLGEKLLLDEESQMRELWESRCANFIGVSTLALTSDNYLIIGQQGSGSMANAGRLAPSGSGSVEFSDLAAVRGANGEISLRNLLAYAAERELCEECGLPRNTKMTTNVVGYARLLERGGKPDFFCVTRLEDLTFAQVQECFNCDLAVTERGQLCAEVKGLLVEGSAYHATLRDYLDEQKKKAGGKHTISIQLHILQHNLKILEMADIDPLPRGQLP